MINYLGHRLQGKEKSRRPIKNVDSNFPRSAIHSSRVIKSNHLRAPPEKNSTAAGLISRAREVLGRFWKEEKSEGLGLFGEARTRCLQSSGPFD